jgi:hypothetical protein
MALALRTPSSVGRAPRDTRAVPATVLRARRSQAQQRRRQQLSQQQQHSPTRSVAARAVSDAAPPAGAARAAGEPTCEEIM